METTCMVRGTQLKGAAYTYTIEKILGQGTFGITYLATSKVQIDGALGALETTLTVAIKEFFMHDLNGRRGNEVTCSSQGGIYEHYRRKFAREAQNLSKLRHPNIVRVLESFEANNTVYYAMEFCEGGSLDELIAAQGGLSEAVALDYARQIGSALDYMHGEKILHLDLKPGNVMLRKNGSVALIDFGLSKQYNEEGAPESSTTIGGGTPGYAPIEQANYREGGQFAAAIDVYALGATLFKMLTGERPAEASVLLNEGFPAEKLTAKGVSEQTIAVVAKAMEGLKRNRYATVAEFLKALDDTAATPPVAPTPEEKTVYNDPAAEATVIDEAPKPAPAPQPKPQPAPVPAPPKKKGSKKGLWILLLLLLIVGGLVVSRIITKPMAEQAVIEEPVEEQPAIEYSDSTGFAATAPQQTDADRLAQEKAAEERRLAKEKAAKEKAEQERLAAEKAKKERKQQEARDAAIRAAKETAEKESKQQTTIVEEEIIDDEPFLKVEKMPTFQGGNLNTFRNWVQSRVKYPLIAIENGIQGRVITSFVIAKDGSLTNIQVLDSPDRSLSEEVIRILQTSPKWTPGMQRTQVVRVKYTLPVDFRIQNDDRGTINGHEWVDLGLSVKWATCNVGASSPSAYGNYYAWGETRTKSKYYSSNSVTYEKSMGDIAGNPNYDAARANWGSSWRMPTQSELEELKNNCTWTWTSQGGHNGYKVTGKNGNSIFLPAAGWRNGSSLSYAGEHGYYWSSTPNESDSQSAYDLYFNSGYRNVRWDYLSNGRTVRPVSE